MNQPNQDGIVLAAIKTIHGRLETELTTVNAQLDYAETLELIEQLCDNVNEFCDLTDDTCELWSIGECSAFDLGSFFVGAYWYFVEHHSGQSSAEYRLQCIVGGIYKPGPCCNGPEVDSTESDVYEYLVAKFQDFS